MAAVAGHGVHIRFDFFFDPVGLGFAETAFQISNDTFKGGFVHSVAVFAAARHFDLFPFGTIKQDIDDIVGQLVHRYIQRKAIVLGQRFHIHGGNGAAFHGPAAAF